MTQPNHKNSSSLATRLRRQFLQPLPVLKDQIMGSVKNMLRLRVIEVHCPQLDNLLHLAKFIVREVNIALTSAIIITLAWMFLYNSWLHSILAFLVTAFVLSYISRRWYTSGRGGTSNEFVLKLRLAKMLFSCICTLFCLIMFLLASLQVFQNMCFLEKAFRRLTVLVFPYPLVPFLKLQVDASYNFEIPVMVFLCALESVLLTDVVTNVIRMNRLNKDYKRALFFEGPIILQCTFRILLGVWIFNLLNTHFNSQKLEIFLLTLVILWNAGTLIDVGFFRTKNPAPRTNDLSGYQMIHDTSWFQVDVDIVAYSVSILLYSQFKSAPALVYPEEASFRFTGDLPPTTALTPSCLVFLDGIWNKSASLYKNHLQNEQQTTLSSRLTFNAEALFLLFMLMISLRFRVNFVDSYKLTRILRNTRWIPQFAVVFRRNLRENYEEELPVGWARADH